jgi:hypothetical protein
LHPVVTTPAPDSAAVAEDDRYSVVLEDGAMFWHAGMVYNNFEIVHVPRFQAADITAFNADIDASMRIYSHRCE